MSKELEYLSDEELDSLINSIGPDELVNAPEDLMTGVLDKIDAKKCPGRRQTLDYGIYCLKVFGSIAAAILIMLTIPYIQGFKNTPDRQEIVASLSAPSRDEVLSRRRIESKEEVLNKEEGSDIITEIKDKWRNVL